MAEIFIICLIVAVTLIPVWISLILKRFLPDRLWLGLIVSFLFNAFGQFYRKGGFVYCLIIVLIESLLWLYTENEVVVLLVSSFLSFLIMFIRFKLTAISTVEESSSG